MGEEACGLRLYPVAPLTPTPLPAHEDTHNHIPVTSLLSPKSQAGASNPLLKNSLSKCCVAFGDSHASLGFWPHELSAYSRGRPNTPM